MAGKKTIKVQPLHVPSKSSFNGYQVVPWLRMSGKWLQTFGFEPGSYVTIEYSHGKMLISVCREEIKKKPAPIIKAVTKQKPRASKPLLEGPGYYYGRDEKKEIEKRKKEIEERRKEVVRLSKKLGLPLPASLAAEP